MGAKRPQKFSDFNGQPEVVETLRVAVGAARKRGSRLAHVLLAGPAGLGKTALGWVVVPNELGVESRFINCSTIEKPQDLTAVLATMRQREVLFLDELHALPPSAREHLLTAMEDNVITVKLPDGGEDSVMTVSLPEFTVIGATTRQGLLDGPLRTRFQYALTLRPYTDAEMYKVVEWHLPDGVTIDKHALTEIADNAHGTARVGVNLLAACIDTVAAAPGSDMTSLTITHEDVTATCRRLGYRGRFTPEEYRYLNALPDNKCVGLQALAVTLNEHPVTVSEVYEPWLLQQGFIVRRAAGRALSQKGATVLARLREEAE